MTVKFTILGCGSSLGVPRVDGNFGKCDPNNKKNYRTRCSALISVNKVNILIDASPDIRSQLISSKIKKIDKVFFTHSHADQTHGINELRIFYMKYKKKIPIYADKNTKKYLNKSFNYCFKDSSFYPAMLKMNDVKKIHNYNYGNNKLSIKSIRVQHGRINSICYIVNNKCAYVPDVSKIFYKDLSNFKDLKYFVVDCLRYDSHPSHFNLDDVLNIIKIIKPKKTILTNLSSKIDYTEIKKILPKNVIPAFDGLRFTI